MTFTINFERLSVVAITMVLSLVVNASESRKSSVRNDQTLATWKKDAEVRNHPTSGKTRFITIKNKKKLQRQKGQNRADSISESYGAAFGLTNPAKELKLKKQTRHDDSVTTYRYQQQYKGIPVIGAELVAGVDALDQLNFISGETALNLALNVEPELTSEQAQDISLNAVAKWYRIKPEKLLSNTPELSIFKPDMISPNTMPARVVWKLTISAEEINELIFVDAISGSIMFHLNQIHSVLNRSTYSADNTTVFQATLICDETDPTCTAGDTDAQAAHQYAADTYNFYFSTHGRDGIDGAGGEIISSVHVGPDFENAAWTGTKMIYGNGFSLADDVVAHELTHGVTEKESNLFYYYQAGAINESFSDIWGEFVDQTNARGNDNANVKWKLGEDIPGVGVVRNMENPPEFSDPDKITSSNYSTSSSDNGGVHTNSGVNNKAAYLMTDGGTFNGQTVTGIGIEKVAKLYYEVQTKHLTSGSDYLDLYNALIQACTDLVTATTLTTLECTQVQKALTAVEMNQMPEAGFNPKGSECPTNSTKTATTFSDNLESGLSNWIFTHDTGLRNNNWVDWLTVSTGAPFATSGVHSLYGENSSTTSDKYAHINVTIPIPLSSEKIFLYFKHVVDFEAVETASQNAYFDGGVLEYSTNSGTSWNDAANLIVDGKNYTGIIESAYSNPLGGRLGFSAQSNGYVSTRVNLSSFSGQSILLRWRVATDTSVAGSGWILDDISIHTCQGSMNSLPTARAGADQYVNNGDSVTLNADSSSDIDAPIVSYNWEQIGGKVVSLSSATTVSPTFTASGGGGILAFKLTVTDSDELTDTDIINVIVNTKPTAIAGTDFSVEESSRATLNGSLSFDTNGPIISYQWTQTANGTSIVVLDDPASANPSFDAPAPNQTLVFSLTVTDNTGNTSSADTVNVTITPRVTIKAGGGGGCSINSTASFNPFMFIVLLGLAVIHLRSKSRSVKISKI